MAICAMINLELEAAYQRIADKAMVKAKAKAKEDNELKDKIEAQSNGQHRKFRVNNPRRPASTPAQLAYKKQYYRKHRESILAEKRVYYADNREEICAYHREYWRVVVAPRRAAARKYLTLSTIDDIK